MTQYDYTVNADPEITATNKAKAIAVQGGLDPNNPNVIRKINASPTWSAGEPMNPTVFDPKVVFPTTISSQTIGGGVTSGSATPINLPTPTPPTTTSSGITARNQSSAEQAKASLDAEEQAYKEEQKTKATTSSNKVMEFLGLQQKAVDEKIAARQTPEFKALFELKVKAINDQISLRKAQDAEINAVRSRTGISTGAIDQEINAINYKYAFQSAQLSLTANIASNNYQSAKQDIDDLYTLTMEKYTPLINYYSQLAQNDQKIFNDAEIRILENKRDESKTAQTQAANFEKQKGTMMIQAKENGADNATIQAMARATDMSGLVQATGQWGVDIKTPTIQGSAETGYFYMKYNPQTKGFDKVAVSGGTSGGGKTSQVLDGLESIWDLTATERSDVMDDLYAKGFGSDVAPTWYKDYLQNQKQRSMLPEKINEEWIKYRDSIMKSPSKKPKAEEEEPSWLSD